MYVATVNVPGYLPMDDDPATFETPAEAWDYLADERERAEEDMSCDETCDDGPACQWGYTHDATDTVVELQAMPDRDIPSGDGTGTVYGETPGYHGDHDLGLAYTVSEVEAEGGVVTVAPGQGEVTWDALVADAKRHLPNS